MTKASTAGKPTIAERTSVAGRTGNAARAKRRKQKSAAPVSAWRRLRRFIFRFVAAFIAVITLIPLVLLLFYRIDSVQPVSTLMIRDWATGVGARREWVDIGEMSPFIYQSVLMSEDGKFCAHGGIDWEALNTVIEDAISGEKTRGASTITMQLVKNLFLWPDRSFVRKGLEIPYAIMAEQVLSKKRIMEIYLNIVELDTGVFGVGAAAQHYFNRSALDLGPRFSARLAVTLPDPKGRNPAKPSNGLRRLAATIVERARASGAYIKCLTEAT